MPEGGRTVTFGFTGEGAATRHVNYGNLDNRDMSTAVNEASSAVEKTKKNDPEILQIEALVPESEENIETNQIRKELKASRIAVDVDRELLSKVNNPERRKKIEERLHLEILLMGELKNKLDVLESKEIVSSIGLRNKRIHLEKISKKTEQSTSIDKGFSVDCDAITDLQKESPLGWIDSIGQKGNTSKIQNIRLCSDGSYLIETVTSTYRINILGEAGKRPTADTEEFEKRKLANELALFINDFDDYSGEIDEKFQEDKLFVKSEIGKDKFNEGYDRIGSIYKKQSELFAEYTANGATQKLFEDFKKCRNDLEKLVADVEKWKAEKSAMNVLTFYANEVLNEKILGGGNDGEDPVVVESRNDVMAQSLIDGDSKIKDLFLEIVEKKMQDPQKNYIMNDAQKGFLYVAVRKYLRQFNNDIPSEQNENSVERCQQWIDQTKTARIEKIKNGFDAAPIEEGYVNVGGFSIKDSKLVDRYRLKANIEIEEALAARKQKINPDEEKYKFSRAGAEITLGRTKKYDELNADSLQEGDEKFLAKTRELWKEFAVHNLVGKDRETGEKIIINKSDLDGKCCVELLKLAGIDVSDLKYINQGEFEEGRINLDTGGKEGLVVDRKTDKNGLIEWGKTAYIDHHDPEESKAGTSAAAYTYKTLVDLGLLEKKEEWDKMLEFVTSVDSGNPLGLENYFKNSWKTVSGLNNYITGPKLVEFFKQKDADPTKELTEDELIGLGFKYEIKKTGDVIDRIKQQKKRAIESLKKLREMEKEGYIISSDRYGKIAVSIEDNPREKNLSGDFLAARAYSCDTFIKWNPKEERFSISAKVPIEEKFPQGLRVREMMWIKNNNDDSELQISLGEILNKMTDGKLATRGKLKEFLAAEKDPSVARSGEKEKKKKSGGESEKGTPEEMYEKIANNKRVMIEAMFKENYDKIIRIASAQPNSAEYFADDSAVIKDQMLDDIQMILRDKFDIDDKERKVSKNILEIVLNGVK